MDVDVGKTPEPHQMSPATEPASIPTLDGWIESLMNCKQLSENDVRRLTDRVGTLRAGLTSSRLLGRVSLVSCCMRLTLRCVGTRSITGRVKRPTSGESTTGESLRMIPGITASVIEMSSYCLRGYTRPISRPHGAF